MTKNDLAIEVSKKCNITPKQSNEIINAVLGFIKNSLKNKKKVEIRNFGIFRVYKRNSVQRRNPKTGAKVIVPDKNIVRFKAGERLKKMVNK